MSNPALMPGPATAGGFLLVIAIILPVIGMLLTLALRGPYPERIALVVMPAGVAVAVVITAELWRTRSVLQYFVGGWAPPLGVAFRADGLSAVMMLTSALLISGIGLFARAQFPSSLRREARAPSVFWILLLAIWGALNAVFIGGDLFNLYVALELLTFAAVPLVSLWTAVRRPSRLHCVICFSHCSVLFSICSARCCSTAHTARSISLCCRAAFTRSRRVGPLSR
jgi:multicomponent Na+:H+ antiporter subunit D